MPNNYPLFYWNDQSSDERWLAEGQTRTGQTLWTPNEGETVVGAFDFYRSSAFLFTPEYVDEIAALPCKKWTNQLLNRVDLPEFPRWKQIIDQTLANTELTKAVIARETQLTFRDHIDPFALLSQLEQIGKNVTYFCLCLDENTAFIGATPEMLYKRNDRTLESVAIAGTVPNGEEALKRLLDSSKDRYEQDIVRRRILQDLEQIADDITSSNLGTVTTSHAQHLKHHFKGLLKDHVTDQDIINLLHPTPALGGEPKEKALSWIKSQEPFNRGWYGSPIGYTRGDKAHFAVAIRSAVIYKNKVRLFAGTGIVDGSEAESEWRELEVKIAPFMQALGLTKGLVGAPV